MFRHRSFSPLVPFSSILPNLYLVKASVTVNEARLEYVIQKRGRGNRVIFQFFRLCDHTFWFRSFFYRVEFTILFMDIAKRVLEFFISPKR